MNIIPSDYLDQLKTLISSPSVVRDRLLQVALQQGLINQTHFPIKISDHASMTELYVSEDYKVNACFEISREVSWRHLELEPYCWLGRMLSRAYEDVRRSLSDSAYYLTVSEYSETHVPVTIKIVSYLNDLNLGQADISQHGGNDRDLKLWSRLVETYETYTSDRFSLADSSLSEISTLIDRINPTYQRVRHDPDGVFFNVGDFVYYEGGITKISAVHDQSVVLRGIHTPTPISEIMHVIYPSGHFARKDDIIGGIMSSGDTFSDQTFDVLFTDGVPTIAGNYGSHPLIACNLVRRTEVRHGDSVYSMDYGVHGTVLGMDSQYVDLLLTSGDFIRTQRSQLKYTPADAS